MGFAYYGRIQVSGVKAMDGLPRDRASDRFEPQRLADSMSGAWRAPD